jgi:hypothetical protein
MRLGFIGPCRGDVAALRPLAELLLFELDVTRAVYLGADDALDRAIKGWPERLQALSDESAFLAEAALLAPEAPPDILDALVERDRKLHRLADLAALPPPPARAVEMFDDRVVLMVHDKSVLDEDDVANATAIVWGNSAEPQLRPIGPRVFLSPGWVMSSAGPHVALVEHTEDGILAAVRDRTGRAVHEHRVTLSRTAKMGVQ